MLIAVNTCDLAAVRAEVGRLFQSACPGHDWSLVNRSFAWAEAAFTGRVPGYQPIDVDYHDMEHTLQGTLCLARLLWGRQRSGDEPRLTARQFEMALVGILFHDTGYLKTVGDTVGSGAKYTVTHVTRSAEFASDFLTDKGFTPAERAAIQRMIHCTGLAGDVTAQPFESEAERLMGYALGTADFLGQMAAPDYIEKLPVLYEEFAEAERLGQSTPCTHFDNAEHLKRNTPTFWRHFVMPRLDREFRGLYRYLNDPYPLGPNPYLEAVEANIRRITGG